MGVFISHRRTTYMICYLELRYNILKALKPLWLVDRDDNYGSHLVKDVPLYRDVVGALQYTTISRREITCSFDHVCQFMRAPLEAHSQAAKWILRYLVGILNLRLIMQQNLAHIWL